MPVRCWKSTRPSKSRHDRRFDRWPGSSYFTPQGHSPVRLPVGNHNRDALATLLWPEKGQSSARAALRRGLYFINKALGNQWLQSDLETAGLNPELKDSLGAALWLDVVEFQQQLKACEKHEHPATETCPECIPHLESAVDLYTDHFMADFSLMDCPAYDEWQFFQDESLRGQLASTLVRLSSFYTSGSRQDFETAIGYARCRLSLDPLHEPAHHHLMALYADSGQKAAAIRQYHECVRILEDELGIHPSKETTQLYQRVQSEEIYAARHGISKKFIGRPDEATFIDSLLDNPDVLLNLVDDRMTRSPAFKHTTRT